MVKAVEVRVGLMAKKSTVKRSVMEGSPGFAARFVIPKGVKNELGRNAPRDCVIGFFHNPPPKSLSLMCTYSGDLGCLMDQIYYFDKAVDVKKLGNGRVKLQPCSCPGKAAEDSKDA